SAYIKNNILKPKENEAVAICPGPNIAYFSGRFTLDEMIKHIYGKISLLNEVDRPNLFVNELKLYVEYLKKDINVHLENLNEKKEKQLIKFKEQLQNGINYYKDLIPKFFNQTEKYKEKTLAELAKLEAILEMS